MSLFSLGALKGVTITTSDLDASLAAYQRHLDYRSEPVEAVGAHRAKLWRAPGAASARMAVMRASSGGDRFLRFVEAEDAGHDPFMTYGWAAAEIVVENLDRLADRLATSPFKIIGPPAVLDFDFTDQIRAMQVEGPSREILYLTEIGADIPGFDLPRASGPVGDPFIAVLGAPSLAAAADGYAALGRAAGPVMEARIDVLSTAHDLPVTTRHRLTTVPLANRTLVEIDDFPSSCSVRETSSIGLVSGIAIVSFSGLIDGDPLSEPHLITGAACELIELLP